MGNVTCTSVISNTGSDWLHDVKLEGQDCQSFLLAPGKSASCHTIHQTTQHDIDNFDEHGVPFEAVVFAQAHSLSNTSHMIYGQGAIHLPLPVVPSINITASAAPTLVSTAGRPGRQTPVQKITL